MTVGMFPDTFPRKYRHNLIHSQRDIAALADVLKYVVNHVKVRMDQHRLLEANCFGKCGQNRITPACTDRQFRDIYLQHHKINPKDCGSPDCDYKL
ncbi:hypothetical protein ABEB36_007338 [Hypothenemus hampei]|uniref:Uncharacterized protein n=1 Tax=Hypothenemus hampei TaxID=57062 RepID=A0ABD1EUH7_HYPHA